MASGTVKATWVGSYQGELPDGTQLVPGETVVEIPAGDVRRVHLEPVDDITARISEELQNIGRDAPVAVLPEGPMTVPYLEHARVRA